MWQTSNNKVGSGERKGRLRSRLPVHIKRASATLKLLGPNYLNHPTIEARVLLNDLSVRGLGLFTTRMLTPGLEIQIVFEEPKPFTISGKIVWCHEHHLNSHVLTPVPFLFRAGLLFSYENSAQADEVRQLYEGFARELISMFKGA